MPLPHDPELVNKNRVMSAGLVAGALVLGACGSDSDVEVEDAWARNSPAAVSLGAAYFDLTVAADDRLVAVQVSGDVAASAEIHEVVESDTEMSGDMSEEMSGDMSGEMDDTEMSEGSHDDMDMGGMMTMQQIENGLALTGGETVSFAPGSYHVMLIDLADPLEVGDEFELTLEFENADSTTVTVEVRESAP